MKIFFKYDLEKEYDNLKCTIGSLNNPGQLPPLAKELLDLGIKFDDKAKVLQFFDDEMKNKEVSVSGKISELTNGWDLIASEVEIRLKRLFDTDLDLGNITSYLTISMMCGYNIENKYFFISVDRIHPNKTIVHELLHFYTHILYEKRFEDLKLTYENFNDYKEGLTFLLQTKFNDILEGDLEDGYEKQATIRSFLKSKWPTCKNINELTDITVRQFFNISQIDKKNPELKFRV